MIIHVRGLKILVLFYIFIFSGCAHHFKLADENIKTLYISQDTADFQETKWSPAFLTHGYNELYNRIGRPAASDESGDIRLYVNNREPAMFYMRRKFSTDKGSYTNLIYRIHFSSTPFSLMPFYLGFGKNIGLLVVITLDEHENPVLVTTVHTCGCYVAIIPTSYLAKESYPLDWKEKQIRVYGERLPWLLDYGGIDNPRLIVHLRPGVHRVMGLQVVDADSIENSDVFNLLNTPLLDINALEKIPLNGKTVSFYHDSGLMRGFVKGAVKPLETLLLSIVSLDFFIGTDKVYADSDKSGNIFYTSLKPWNRRKSDMWEFERFLRFWGWQL